VIVRIDFCPVEICVGENDAVTPGGVPEMLRDASPEKPLLLFRLTAYATGCPGTTVAEPGPTVREKEDGSDTVNGALEVAL
jgi:hypothetical protein